MLIAVTPDGARRVAAGADRGESFACPSCGAPLVVRVPRSRVPHFAHLPGQRCQVALSRAARRAEARRRAAERRVQAQLDEAEAAGQQPLFELSAT